MAPASKTGSDIKQRPLKDFFLKYTRPIDFPDKPRPDSPFAPFCVIPPVTQTVTTPVNHEPVTPRKSWQPRPSISPKVPTELSRGKTESPRHNIDTNGLQSLPPDSSLYHEIKTTSQNVDTTISEEPQEETQNDNMGNNIMDNMELSGPITRTHNLLASQLEAQNVTTPVTVKRTRAVTPPPIEQVVRSPRISTQEPSLAPVYSGFHSPVPEQISSPPATVKKIASVVLEENDTEMDYMPPIEEPDTYAILGNEESPRADSDSPTSSPTTDVEASVPQLDGVIDLTRSQSSDSLSSFQNTGSRKRSSLSRSNPFLHTAAGTEERPSKFPRLVASSSQPALTSSRPPKHKHDQSIETSSVLSSIGSRTPTPPPKASQSLSFMGSTQGSRTFVRSSQSDEDIDPEDMEVEQHPPRTVISPPVEDNNDSLSSDSDSSLEDVTALFIKKKMPEKSLPITNDGANDLRRSTRNSRTHSEIGNTTNSSIKSTPRSCIPTTPKYRFSLGDLIKQNQRNANTEKEIERAKSILAENHNNTNNENERGFKAVKFDEDLLQKVVKEEEGEDKLGKLMHAMGRADMLTGDFTWYFLGNNTDRSDLEVPPFPRLDSNHSLYCLTGPVFREQAFRTGFASDIFAKSKVPDAVIPWLWEAGLKEPRRHLAYTYVEVLKTMLSQSQFVIDTERIQSAFETFNARPVAIQPTAKIQPMQRSKISNDKTPVGLINLIKVLNRLTESLPKESKVYSTTVLLRLAIDETSHKCGELRLELQRTLASLLRSFPDDEAEHMLEEIAISLHNTIDIAVLQHRLVTLIPSTSARSHTLKRRLALAFALKEQKILSSSYSLTVSHDVDIIIKAITTDPRYSTSLSSSTPPDFRSIGALLSLLDIGIDAGFSSLFPRPPTVKADANPSLLHSNMNNTTPSTIPDLKAAENAFNNTIDALIVPIRALSRSIVDSGASHLAKTDAKAVVERLIVRLEYAVRTRPRPKRSVLGAASGFGGGGTIGRSWGEGKVAGEKRWMETWVRNGVKNEVAEAGVPGVDGGEHTELGHDDEPNMRDEVDVGNVDVNHH